MTFRPSAQFCPACGGAVSRSRRRRAERELVPGHRRWRCREAACVWTGLLPDPKPAPAPGLQPGRGRKRAGRWLAAAGIGAVAALVTTLALRSPAQEAVMIGPHVVVRGTHLEGEPLPAAHPLRSALAPSAVQTEPAASSLLRLRRHCAWGLPGRNPYRGSAEQALRTASLSTTVVQQIAADIRAGKRVDRVTISNDSIRAQRSGREFDTQRVAMTYGMTMCVDTRVNFSPGHTEQGDLYEAMDEDGRIYAVMVPDVCGNVSVLGQRYVKAPAAPQTAADATAADPGVPSEDRVRELPALLRFADRETQSTGGRSAAAARSASLVVSTPGTLALAALALVLAGLAGRSLRRVR